MLVDVCNAVPPEAAAYHTKVGVAKPEVLVTEQAGIAVPHWLLAAEAVGAVGNGLTVTGMAAEVAEQPLVAVVTKK